MSEVKYEIKESLAVLPADNGWTLELNLISWNNANPKYDLRKWNEDHSRMSKGVTLTKEEACTLFSTHTVLQEKLGIATFEDISVSCDTSIKELTFD